MRLKEIKMTTVKSLALASMLAALVVAQQPAKPGQEKHPGKQMMTMDEMMQGGRKHCQETAKSIDQTTKMIDEAKQSNEPARMRDALGQARKSLAEMKNHMDTGQETNATKHGVSHKPPVLCFLFKATILGDQGIAPQKINKNGLRTSPRSNNNNWDSHGSPFIALTRPSC